MTAIGVGIVGASAERGWAKVSHVPAVQQLPGLKLVAVASGTQEKADAAAKAFGVERGYADAMDLIRDPKVDLVTVAVKVPDHRELVLAAVAAGKHLYCEWPLGRNQAETEELAEAAQKAGVHVAIGLQTRGNAVTRRAHDLVASNVIGRVLSARVLSSTIAFGPDVEAAMAFGEDGANGVTLLTIQGAHTLDFCIAVLGQFVNVTALLTTQFPEVKVGADGAVQKRLTPDHVLTQVRLVNGAALGVEVAGGRPKNDVTFTFEVTGERGVLAVDGGAIRGFQSGRLRLLLNGEVQQVEEGETSGMTEEATSVAGIYALLRNDIISGTRTTPDFEHAVRLTRLVEDVVISSDTGRRKDEAGWPLQ